MLSPQSVQISGLSEQRACSSVTCFVKFQTAKRSKFHLLAVCFSIIYSTYKQAVFNNLSCSKHTHTKDLLASGRNCPNSESRSSCPLNRFATSVNTSSSDMPRKGRPLVFSCSFCKSMHRC